jgi:hypothetical protein
MRFRSGVIAVFVVATGFGLSSGVASAAPLGWATAASAAHCATQVLRAQQVVDQIEVTSTVDNQCGRKQTFFFRYTLHGPLHRALAFYDNLDIGPSDVISHFGVPLPGEYTLKVTVEAPPHHELVGSSKLQLTVASPKARPAVCATQSLEAHQEADQLVVTSHVENDCGRIVPFRFKYVLSGPANRELIYFNSLPEGSWDVVSRFFLRTAGHFTLKAKVIGYPGYWVGMSQVEFDIA